SRDLVEPGRQRERKRGSLDTAPPLNWKDRPAVARMQDARFKLALESVVEGDDRRLGVGMRFKDLIRDRIAGRPRGERTAHGIDHGAIRDAPYIGAGITEIHVRANLPQAERAAGLRVDDDEVHGRTGPASKRKRRWAGARTGPRGITT